jgi:hypothetical protein
VIYSHHLVGVHVLLAIHPEQLADLAVLVAQQFEAEGKFLAELLVRGHGVARDPVDAHPGAPEGSQQALEVLPLERAPWRVIARVEIQHQRLPARRAQAECFAGRGGEGEIGHHAAHRHGAQDFTGSSMASRFIESQ